jgi:hypothetical protein
MTGPVPLTNVRAIALAFKSLPYFPPSRFIFTGKDGTHGRKLQIHIIKQTCNLLFT